MFGINIMNPRHSAVNYDADILDVLEWVWRMSGLLLLNNNLLVDRSETVYMDNISCELDSKEEQLR